MKPKTCTFEPGWAAKILVPGYWRDLEMLVFFSPDKAKVWDDIIKYHNGMRKAQGEKIKSRIAALRQIRKEGNIKIVRAKVIEE